MGGVGFLLFALSPPTNVARAVREVQESLYARWGLISPLSLPPLQPLLFAAGAPSPAEVLRLATALSSRLRGGQALCAPRFRTGGFAVVQGALFWELAGDPAPLRALARTLCPWPALEPPPFPPAQGFFLALDEPGIDLEQAARELAPPPGMGFPASALVLLSVRRLRPDPPQAAPPWYRALEWEELIRIALKKPGRGQA